MELCFAGNYGDNTDSLIGARLASNVLNTMYYHQFDKLVLGENRLFEEEADSANWDKATISYIREHYKTLHNMARSLMVTQSGDTYCGGVEDVLQDVICYFHSKPDYDYEKAREASKAKGAAGVMPIGSYVESILRNYTQRFNTLTHREAELRVDTYIIDEDGEKSLLDIAPDESVAFEFLEVGMDLDNQLRMLEIKRYIYGMDIYFVLYSFARLGSSKFTQLLDIFGVTARELNSFRASIICDEDVMDLLHLLEHSRGTDMEHSAIDKISEYVYGRHDIDNAISFILKD